MLGVVHEGSFAASERGKIRESHRIVYERVHNATPMFMPGQLLESLAIIVVAALVLGQGAVGTGTLSPPGVSSQRRVSLASEDVPLPCGIAVPAKEPGVLRRSLSVDDGNQRQLGTTTGKRLVTKRQISYHSYADIVKRLHALADAYPGLAELFSAQKRYGLPSAGKCKTYQADGTKSPDACEHWVIRLTNRATLSQDPERPQVFFSGNLHGDEKVGPMTVIKLAELLLGAYCAPEEGGVGGSATGTGQADGAALGGAGAEGMNLTELLREQLLGDSPPVAVDLDGLLSPLTPLGGRRLQGTVGTGSRGMQAANGGKTVPFISEEHSLRGFGVKGNAWLRRLLDTREVVLLAVTNPIGYEQGKREELHIDPNRDFPIDMAPGTHDCMRTVVARVLNELWREHVFQMAVTYHGGMQAIAYEWGAPSRQGKNRNSESPDDRAQAQLGGVMRDFAGRYPSKKYPVGRMNDVVYGVRGGMEDWAYASSWDTPLVGYCEPTTYGGYARARTENPNPVSFRTLNVLVETSDRKTPPVGMLGSWQEMLRTEGKGDAHVTRNVRLALAMLDLVEPYVQPLVTRTDSGSLGAAGATAAVVLPQTARANGTSGGTGGATSGRRGQSAAGGELRKAANEANGGSGSNEGLGAGGISAALLQQLRGRAHVVGGTVSAKVPAAVLEAALGDKPRSQLRRLGLDPEQASSMQLRLDAGSGGARHASPASGQGAGVYAGRWDEGAAGNASLARVLSAFGPSGSMSGSLVGGLPSVGLSWDLGGGLRVEETELLLLRWPLGADLGLLSPLAAAGGDGGGAPWLEGALGVLNGSIEAAALSSDAAAATVTGHNAPFSVPASVAAALQAGTRAHRQPRPTEWMQRVGEAALVPLVLADGRGAAASPPARAGMSTRCLCLLPNEEQQEGTQQCGCPGNNEARPLLAGWRRGSPASWAKVRGEAGSGALSTRWGSGDFRSNGANMHSSHYKERASARVPLPLDDLVWVDETWRESEGQGRQGDASVRTLRRRAAAAYLLVASARQVDAEWARQSNPMPAGTAPQSHSARARTDRQWLQEANGRVVRGRLEWRSRPVPVLLEVEVELVPADEEGAGAEGRLDLLQAVSSIENEAGSPSSAIPSAAPGPTAAPSPSASPSVGPCKEVPRFPGDEGACGGKDASDREQGEGGAVGAPATRVLPQGWLGGVGAFVVSLAAVLGCAVGCWRNAAALARAGCDPVEAWRAARGASGVTSGVAAREEKAEVEGAAGSPGAAGWGVGRVLGVLLFLCCGCLGRGCPCRGMCGGGGGGKPGYERVKGSRGSGRRVIGGGRRGGERGNNHDGGDGDDDDSEFGLESDGSRGGGGESPELELELGERGGREGGNQVDEVFGSPTAVRNGGVAALPMGPRSGEFVVDGLSSGEDEEDGDLRGGDLGARGGP